MDGIIPVGARVEWKGTVGFRVFGSDAEEIVERRIAGGVASRDMLRIRETGVKACSVISSNFHRGGRPHNF